MIFKTLLFASTILAAAACGHDDHGHDHNEAEVVTTVTLTFTPESGPPITATFNDPDGDGGEAPSVDDIALSPGTYDVSVGFENRLETPAEIITDEIADEAESHLVFFTGTAVDGPATDNAGAPLEHSYSDEDLDGLPIGLDNVIIAGEGSGELTITLRHLPPLSGTPAKTLDALTNVRTGGFAAIGGASDASVAFSVVVE